VTLQIELISRLPEKKSQHPPLLFIHGAYHSAQCWDEHFLPWFAARGWEAHAVSVRGHGNSDGKKNINQWCFNDYLDDVKHAVGLLDRPPILLGHSMGGRLALKYSENRLDVPAVVLLAASPVSIPKEVGRKLLRMHPITWTLGFLFHNMMWVRRAFESFCIPPNLPSELKQRYIADLCNESYTAVMDVFSGKFDPDYQAINTAVLAIAGEDDWSIPKSDHRHVAKALNGTPMICPGVHDLMLDPSWESTTNTILSWLQQQNFTQDKQIEVNLETESPLVQ